MNKLITNYTFDPIARTIVFNDYTSIVLSQVIVVTNTTDNVIIYNFACLGGTVSGNTLTMSYDTSAMDSGDSLQIFYEDTTISPATEETSTSILGYIVTNVPVISSIYNWLIDKWDNYVLSWYNEASTARQTARNITDQQIIPACNTIIAGRGLILPLYDYSSMVVSPATTETWTFKTGGSGGTTVATLVIVYTDSGRGTISSVTKT